MKTTQTVLPEQNPLSSEYMDLEQRAFERGVRDGEAGYDVDTCPFERPESS